jgi:hypothetical protein
MATVYWGPEAEKAMIDGMFVCYEYREFLIDVVGWLREIYLHAMRSKANWSPPGPTNFQRELVFPGLS